MFTFWHSKIVRSFSIPFSLVHCTFHRIFCDAFSIFETDRKRNQKNISNCNGLKRWEEIENGIRNWMKWAMRKWTIVEHERIRCIISCQKWKRQVDGQVNEFWVFFFYLKRLFFTCFNDDWMASTKKKCILRPIRFDVRCRLGKKIWNHFRRRQVCSRWIFVTVSDCSFLFYLSKNHIRWFGGI